MSSTNYPNANYPNYDACTIAVNASNTVPIHVVDFNTEGWYDKLWVNGIAYSGTTGPQGIVPTQNITWSAAPWLQGRTLMVVAGHPPGACCLCCRRALAYHAVGRITP